jgi:fatty acid desaturase
VSLWLAVALVAITAAQHSSLSHEVIHGHPFKSAFWNAVLVFPSLDLCVPYLRFKDTHLAHHNDPLLTDPYDDPESNYMDPGEWEKLAPWLQRLLRFNNTMLGRLTVGPMIGHVFWLRGDVAAIRGGDRRILESWLLQIPAVALVVWLVLLSPMPLWAYLIGAYASLSLLKIRTFLEHRAHEKSRARTVIIEDRGPLALLFLNNNLHVVHHAHPKVPWYRLPAMYRADPEGYLKRNEGYRYRSYAEVFARYFWRAKDPVPHPLWRR